MSSLKSVRKSQEKYSKTESFWTYHEWTLLGGERCQLIFKLFGQSQKEMWSSYIYKHIVNTYKYTDLY